MTLENQDGNLEIMIEDPVNLERRKSLAGRGWGTKIFETLI